MKALLALLALLCLGAAPSGTINGRVFDRVSSLVAGRYWDRTMHGLDWSATTAQYRPDAIAAPDSATLYKVINRMLARIGDSHVYARSAAQLPPLPRRNDDTGWNRRARWAADGVLLLAFDQFEPGDDRWLIHSLRSYRPRALILDLRHNVGGDADILDRIAGQFVAKTTPLIRLSGRRTIEERTKGSDPQSYRGPIAVLIGPRTTSAAEILAAFLDDSGRAITIGERSKGAVTGGVDHRLPDGGRLTIAEYDIHLASGRRLEREGVTPRHIASEKPGGDAPLDEAIRLLSQPAA